MLTYDICTFYLYSSSVFLFFFPFSLILVQLLISHRAKADAQNEDGFSPILIAAQSGHLNLIQYMVTNSTRCILQGRARFGWTLWTISFFLLLTICDVDLFFICMIAMLFLTGSSWGKYQYSNKRWSNSVDDRSCKSVLCYDW